MREVTAYADESGKIHDTPEAAQAADDRLEYEGRIGTFIAESPLVYEGARDLAQWLKSDKGFRMIAWLLNGGEL